MATLFLLVGYCLDKTEAICKRIGVIGPSLPSHISPQSAQGRETLTLARLVLKASFYVIFLSDLFTFEQTT